MERTERASNVPESFSMKTYHSILEALTTQHELGCSTVGETAVTVRRFLVAHLGLRRFLGTRLNSRSREPAAGWVVEFNFGEHQVHLKNPERTLLDALVQVVEEYYHHQHAWPTGVRKGQTFVWL